MGLNNSIKPFTSSIDINREINNKRKFYSKVELKIGINYGTTLIKLAKRNPSTLYLGIELKKENTEHAANLMMENHIENTIIINGEALSIISLIEYSNFISQIHLYFPTPYPESLDLKSRLVCKKFITVLHRLLITGGCFRFVTDHKEYYIDTLRLLSTDKWQAVDWIPLKQNLKEGFLVGTYCESEFRKDGCEIYELQVIKWT